MSKSTRVIAEAGVNHNGDMDLASRLIDEAKSAGAEVVKFQAFKASALADQNAPMADYQKVNGAEGGSQFEMLRRLELSMKQHQQLKTYAEKIGIEYLCSPFDVGSAIELIETIGLNELKIPSGEITNGPMLLEISRRGISVILSTGVSSLGDIENALSVLAFGYSGNTETPNRDSFRAAYSSKEGQRILKDKVEILHCTSEYPAPYQDVNLRAMGTLRRTFSTRVGFSDHTAGISVPIAASALGASTIEKHFTLDCNLPGPDHKASLEPHELKAMVEGIRQACLALGTPVKTAAASELKNRDVIRKSLYAARPISKGQIITWQDLLFLRPGGGISPMDAWEVVGKPAPKDFAGNEILKI